MARENDGDADLAALRSRRLAEIRARATSAPRSERTASHPVALSSASFREFLTNHPRSVVDVWAPWCGPCRTLAPVLDALANELAGQVSFGKLNAEEEPVLATRWNVDGIPTLLVFERGQLVDRIVGAYPHDVLASRLRARYRLPPGSSSGEGE
jgi:thioredoxin 1